MTLQVGRTTAHTRQGARTGSAAWRPLWRSRARSPALEALRASSRSGSEVGQGHPVGSADQLKDKKGRAAADDDAAQDLCWGVVAQLNA